MAITSDSTPEQLRATLSGACYRCVELYDDGKVLPPLPEMSSLVVAALDRSVAMLTALHSLPLQEPQDDQELGLAAFTRLCELTLHQTSSSPDSLRAAQLPTSLQELSLKLNLPNVEDAIWESLPRLVAFDRLCSLQRITFAGFLTWDLSFREGIGRPLLLPPNLKVCTVASSRCCALQLSSGSSARRMRLPTRLTCNSAIQAYVKH